jgi:antitoxin-like ribbon-helix-helix protein
MKTPIPEADIIPRKGLTLRLNPTAWRQLRQLAFDDELPAHDLLIEALNDYFKKRGKPPVA